MKSITPQRKVTRSIKAIDEESGEERELNDVGEEDVPEDPCGYDDGVGDCARYNYLQSLEHIKIIQKSNDFDSFAICD